jgi:hypothetical protein
MHLCIRDIDVAPITMLIFDFVIVVCFFFHFICIRSKMLRMSIDAYIVPLLFIEVPVPSQESERVCICVLGVSILPHCASLIFDFELFRQCRIFVCFLMVVSEVICFKRFYRKISF